jgi:transposase-like protein
MQAGVTELCTREKSAQAVADKLGVCRPTLYNWKNQLLGREAPASMKRGNQTPSQQMVVADTRRLMSLLLEHRPGTVSTLTSRDDW